MITAFPDATDRMIPDIGYLPGHLTWRFGEKLKALGVTIANSDPDESMHKDRKLLTGASPLAANALGKLAAETLLSEVAAGEHGRALDEMAAVAESKRSACRDRALLV